MFPEVAVIVTDVAAVTAFVVTAKFAADDPAGTVTLAGTVTADVLLLDSATVSPPLGAAEVRATVPWAAVPPVTLAGLTNREESTAVVGGCDAAPDVKRRTADQAPATPAELIALTRHQCRRPAFSDALNCDGVTTLSTDRGAVKLLESSICIR
jgi:hypothetical protein